jgi:signal transduction histidine kinase
MSELSGAYIELNSDSAIAIARRAIALSQQINFPRGEVRSLTNLGTGFDTKGDLPQALEINFQAFAIAEENKLPLERCICLNKIGDIFWDLNNYPRAISYYQQAAVINKEIKDQPEAPFWKRQTEQNLGAVFMLNDQLDSAFAHLKKLYTETLNDNDWHPVILMFFGDLQFRMGKKNEGLNDLRQSIDLFQKNGNRYSLGDACRFISECFREMNMTDSSIFYAKKGLAEAQAIGYSSPILYTSRTLAELYESKDIGKALYYRKVYDTVNDIYYGPDKVKGLQTALSDEQERQKKLEAAAIEYKNRLKQYGLLAGSCIILLIAFILYRNNQHKKKANILLQHQKEKVEDALAELKSAQSQLIQSEKMASLGELTAGIAHEIQNPLNFVNNFSEVSNELIGEIQEERNKAQGTRDEQMQDEILSDIKQNLEKINHHGKRADAIVKGMLQHSRSSTGEKELTDINALADEYLRLSYHGLRAKDISFNATMKTDFDNTIGKINIIPQDIGRVLLNLYNNAFYAVNEKQNAERLKQNAEYHPTVSVQTKKMNDKVVLTVMDNGGGIPQKIIDKIFQPFFTTKPTGQGTGLGLSLSYDIIKAHGGEIKVETKEGEGTEFIIQLPVV